MRAIGIELTAPKGKTVLEAKVTALLWITIILTIAVAYLAVDNFFIRSQMRVEREETLSRRRGADERIKQYELRIEEYNRKYGDDTSKERRQRK